MLVLPAQIFHADWGANAGKRWLASAQLGSSNRYVVSAPRSILDHSSLIDSIRGLICDGGTALIGFDFPIGLPAAYARLAGVREFKNFLQTVGQGAWADFYKVAREQSEISLRRPFYPLAPGGRKQTHLLEALGVSDIDELRRECDKKHEGRRAACPLFWTLGANQVGKGAIVGWKDVLAPVLQDGDVAVWPFDGRLRDLLRPRRIVVAETYPAEYYGWFFPYPLKGKGNLDVRKVAGSRLVKWAVSLHLSLDRALLCAIEQGFPDGDDAFDAVVGLFAMIGVVAGVRLLCEPADGITRKIEGWILGQACP